MPYGSMLSGSTPSRSMPQAWYESGGPIETALQLLVTGSVFTELYKVVQPFVLFDRIVMKRWATSQLKLNQLYAPPPMMVGELCTLAHGLALLSCRLCSVSV